MSRATVEITLEIQFGNTIKQYTGYLIGIKKFISGKFLVLANGNGVFYANPDSYSIVNLTVKQAYEYYMQRPSFDTVEREFNKLVTSGVIKLRDDGFYEGWLSLPNLKIVEFDKSTRIVINEQEYGKDKGKEESQKEIEEYKLIVNKAEKILEMLNGREQRDLNANPNSGISSS